MVAAVLVCRYCVARASCVSPNNFDLRLYFGMWLSAPDHMTCIGTASVGQGVQRLSMSDDTKCPEHLRAVPQQAPLPASPVQLQQEDEMGHAF